MNQQSRFCLQNRTEEHFFLITIPSRSSCFKCIYHCHGRKLCSSFFVFIILPFSPNSPAHLIPSLLQYPSISPVSDFFFFLWYSHDSPGHQKTPSPTFSKPSPVHLCLALGRLVFLGCHRGNIRWPGTPQPKPRSSGSAPLTVSIPRPPLSYSCFQVQAKVKTLRMHSPDLTTRQAGGAALLPDSIYSFTSYCSLIFISLAQAFTEINTDAKVSFFFFFF